MRTVKASEVVKGMRVRASKDSHGVTTTTEGEVIQGWSQTNPCVIFADGSHKFLGSDHPVTVLAEPEPEWVEGAWYRCQVGENEPESLRRLPHGWSPFHDTERVFHEDDEDITVLGRVLIVDWPGDDAARAIEHGFLPDGEYIAPPNVLLAKVADAIRTQGGVR